MMESDKELIKRGDVPEKFLCKISTDQLLQHYIHSPLPVWGGCGSLWAFGSDVWRSEIPKLLELAEYDG